MLSHERLLQVLSYDPASGVFVWLRTLGSKAPKGCLAGSLTKRGYLKIVVDRQRYYIDRDPLNNRWENLRPCNRNGNIINRKLSTRNKTGHLGVSFVTRRKKYQAQIRRNNRKVFLGEFFTLEEASQAYREACAQHAYADFVGEMAANGRAAAPLVLS